MNVEILSLFPEYFQGPFNESTIRRAQEKGLVTISLLNIRDFATGSYKQVDDRPYGGGPGMILMPEPVTKALRHVRKEDSHVIYLSPQGSPLTAVKCQELSEKKNLVLLCGHYEGIDQRVIDNDVDEEISIGDYVLSNGCLPAIVLLDAVVRFIPGVLGNEASACEDSFQDTILDCPHYTRPANFEDSEVPAVLQNGNHKEIEAWRKDQALKTTKERRPDLFARYQDIHKVYGA
jgi:tRNA (guanine37-N1)-methyltransferase